MKANSRYYEVKNWQKFQHYKDREPIWIKLYKSALTDEAITMLSVGSRSILPWLWLAANNKGQLSANCEYLSKLIHFPADEIESAMLEMAASGLLFYHDASNTLAGCYQDASLEKRREERQERKQEREEKIRKKEIHTAPCGAMSFEDFDENVPPKPKTHALSAKQFGGLRALYPNREGQQRWRAAESYARARIVEGSTLGELEAGTRRYQAYCREKGITGTQFVMQAATFFGTNRGFEELWEISEISPPNGRLPTMDEMLANAERKQHQENHHHETHSANPGHRSGETGGRRAGVTIDAEPEPMGTNRKR